MRIIFATLVTALFLSCSAQRKQQQNIQQSDVERILRSLSADDMKGRAAFTPAAEKAASLIETEFRKAGIDSISGNDGYRQTFNVTRITPSTINIIIDGNTIGDSMVAVYTDKGNLDWNTDVEVIAIEAGQNLFARFSEIIKMNKQVLVLVDPAFGPQFANLKNYLANGRIAEEPNPDMAAVFVLGLQDASSYKVTVANQIEKLPLFNVAATLPGKSKKDELVIFSAHYDHIGVLPPVNSDSIANGADDNASGVAAVISLANYFKKQNNNERTLVFVAFAAEEMGLVGSKYFSKNIDADQVVAMFNIEMIGKESKFGKNAAFITGFERSDFGTILQENLKGTEFTFHPDPYAAQNLFYRSDNASLAAVGVPAHTISTSQIDNDKYYHTVDDEIETLDVANIATTIRAIALSSRTIVAGKHTPKRVTKLEN